MNAVIGEKMGQIKWYSCRSHLYHTFKEH